ncbi:MAG: DNA polymerase III subunit alpha [Nitrospirales bacterium]|nr:DNA polymerase III subunit alpha [Nitrospirales bacterium]
MASQFVHLHVHTQYSLLDGANQIDALVKETKNFDMPAVAITDHGNLFGAIEFYQKATAAGIKPIIGCEAYMAPKSRRDREGQGQFAHNEYFHLILLAANRTGYQNLLKLASKAYLEGFYYKPRMDKELLAEHHEGLIALSGCLSGEVPNLIGKDRLEDAVRTAAEYRDMFGKDNYFLEVQENAVPEQQIANKGLREIHKRLGIPLVATNDCHYLKKTDAKVHDILLCLQTGKTVNEPNRMRFNTDQLYVKSTEEMLTAFHEWPEAVWNTSRVAELCELNFTFGKSHLPHYTVPEGETLETYLDKLAQKGLAERLRERPSGLPDAQYRQRLRDELTVITSMGFAGYFLIVWDIINFARSRGIPVGPGRGSSAGSLVAYALRITDLDPLVYGLLFERFLNPERVSLPDIDMDFCMDRRPEVINYVVDKYGNDHVCQIITFGTMRAKAAIRDVGRVMEMPYAEVDRLAKLVPDQLNITLDEALAAEPRLKELVDTDPKIREVFETARALEKSPRHASTHAAGVVISQDPLTAHVPLYRGAKEGDEIVTQFPMGDVERVGLVKFDFLGLKTLTMIAHAERLINQGGGAFTIASIPFTDAKTFALVSSGRTAGVFQLESTGMRDMLTGLRPDRFEDIIASIALYRPGPMDLIPDFVKRKQGKVAMTYEVPALEEILKETYGVIVYQEQVMAIANKIAGFSLGQADILRRAMGKKKPEEMAKLRAQFLEGAKKHKLTDKKAEKLFELIQKFAGYGFNKSHAAAYAVVTYQTAYLKAHHPNEFMAALLTSEMGNTDKVVRYINECRDLNIKVLPPDVNESGKDFSVIQEGIRFGLAAIKNVGEGAIEAIITARENGGPYASFFDFCHRVDIRKVNKRALECFIKAGAFDSTGARRAQLAAVLDRTVDQALAAQQAESQGQTSIFTAFESPEDPSSRRGTLPFDESLPDLPEWDEDQLLKCEKELIGFYITSHPLARYTDAVARFSTTSTDRLSEVTEAKEVKLCGLVGTVKQTLTKRGDRMAYITLEDLNGIVEVIVFPDLYKTASALITLDTAVQVTGTLDRGDKATRIKATKIAGLADLLTSAYTRVSIQVSSGETSSQSLHQLRDVLRRHPGPCPVYLNVTIPDHFESMIAVAPDLRVLPNDRLVGDIEELIGKGAVLLQ